MQTFSTKKSFMRKLNIPGTSIQYSNPQQVDQNTLAFPTGMVTPGCPPNVNGSLAGVTWTCLDINRPSHGLEDYFQINVQFEDKNRLLASRSLA
jgi:hypothetical protein